MTLFGLENLVMTWTNFFVERKCGILRKFREAEEGRDDLTIWNKRSCLFRACVCHKVVLFTL